MSSRDIRCQQVKKPGNKKKVSIKQMLKQQQQQNPQHRHTAPQQPLQIQQDEDPNAQRIKLVLLGDGSCGKTSALISYTTDNFNIDYTPTIFDSYESIIKKGENTVRLELWDTAGQDEYKMLRSLSYPRTDVFLICFSMVDKNTFYNALNNWLKEVRENCPRAEVVFVGTKIDIIADYKMLKDTAWQVLDEQKVCKRITSMGFQFLTCSALTQKGLNEVFDCAIDAVLKKRRQHLDIKKSNDMQCQLI